MARLRNTPQQRLTFDLERRKSYSFRCVLLDGARNPLNLGGCTLRFVVKRSEFDDDQFDVTNMIVNTAANIPSPESGEATFSFQAAELDGPPGTYNYSIVLWTPDGYSATIMKGEFNLHANTESSSMQHTYTTGTSAAAVELTLRGNDVVNIVANSMSGGGFSNDIIGTGRPDDPSTLEARTMQLVNQAAVGTLFISLDGAGSEMWAWRKRVAGWAVVEGPQVQTTFAWNDVTNKPPYIGAGLSPEEARANIGAAAILVMTQAQFDALPNPDPSTMYFITT